MKNMKRMLALLLVIALVASNAPMAVTAVTTNADGYIEIRTIEDLYNIRDDLTANYILMNDIDLTAATATGGDWDFMGNGWNPIGSNDIYGNLAFSGEFDGNGKTIIGMRIKSNTMPSGVDTKYVGLFANVSGSVHDLTFKNTSIVWSRSGYGYIGVVAGHNSGNIYNIYSDATIKTTNSLHNCVGGIVGRSAGTISHCANIGNIDFQISNSSGTATSNTSVGGVVGYNENGTIECCYNTGDISYENVKNGSDGSIGGICGSGNGTIHDCYNVGDVSTDNTYYAAGICGGTSASTITNSYSIGSITSGANSIAITGSKLTNCYYLKGMGTSNTGATSLSAGQTLIQSMYKGFDFETVWVMDPAAVYPYPQLRENVQDLRVATGIEVTALPTKTEYAYGEKLDLKGLEVSLLLQDGSSEVVDILADMVTGYNATTPGVQTLTVTWNRYSTTFTVEVSPEYFAPVYTVQDLYNIRLDLAGKYILMNDIDLTEATAVGGDYDYGGRGWNPIGSNDIYADGAFSGIFNGNGYSIKGMRISLGNNNLPAGVAATTYAGLFAKVTGEVRNLTMKDTQILGAYGSSQAYVGAIAGYNTGKIENCAVSGKVTASSAEYVGGIVGENTGVISGCFNNAEVEGKARAGGIAGQNYAGTIQNCYNTGKVSSSGSGSYAGGIVAYLSNSSSAIAKIINCYNMGKVSGYYRYGVAYIGNGTITNSYYLAGSGNSSTGATSLTEAQMLISDMFVGFDFDKVWIQNIDANYPYPQLRNNVQDLNETATVVSIISLPEKLEYFVGDALVLDGCMINVFFKSGRSELLDVTADMISGFDPNTVGEQTVTVTFRNASDTFTVTVKERPEITGVELLSGPAKTEFVVGTAFDFSGAKAKVSYSTGETELVDITVDMTTGGNIHHLGKQTITATVYDQTLTFDITVIAVAVGSLRIESMPNKLTYIEGQELDLTGLKLVAVMNNGNQSEVTTGYTVSGYKNTIGVHTVTITYKGKTASFDVTVKARAAVALELRAEPKKTEYVSGQKLDTTGMVIIAVYDNGDTALLEEYTISGFSTLPGIHTITVSSGELSVAFTVTVLARTVSKLEILSKPAKLTYLENDEFDPTGMVVQATYNDGDTAIITEYDVIGYSALPGTYTLSVVYDGLIDTFDVTVKAKELTNLVVTPPTKLYYELNEEFDPTGMKVVACYNNGEQAEVLGYTITGFDSKTPGLKTIIISYCGKLSQFNVSVAKRNEIQTNGSFIVGNPAARPGEQVRIPVTVSGNVGIAGMQHTITFKTEALTFVSLEMAQSFGGTLVVNDAKASQGIIDLVWFSGSDVKADGIAYELVFQVKDNAPGGNTAIGLDFSVNDNANLRGDNLVFAAVNGSVDVLNYWLGDLDGDRKFAMVDLVMLAQYVSGREMDLTEDQLLAADVNEDKVIDIHDVVLLNQWLLDQDI